MSEWLLRYEGYDPAEEGLREALCTLGNGYLATRGAAAEIDAGGHHYPATYVAGVFNRLSDEVAGRVIENESMVNQPNWLPLGVRPAGGGWLRLDGDEVVGHTLELDVRRGVLTRRTRWRDGEGRRTVLTERRLVSMADPHLMALETTVVAENWSGALDVRSTVDGAVSNAGVPRYAALTGVHLAVEDVGEADSETVWLTAVTTQSRVRTGMAARTRACRAGRVVDVARRLVAEDGLVGHELSVDVTQGDPVTVEKVVALHTSRDQAISEPGLDARERVAAAGTFDDLLARHVLAWDQLWRRFRLEVDDDETSLILNLHVFHLLQTVSPNTVELDVGVPARGLHGEAYRGHIFWDELFIFPFLNLRLPELTRSLLRYRYRRLDAARRAAREEGYAGAMFPWQSGSNGREESQRMHLNPKSGRWIPDASHRQRHIGVAIAYEVWQYYEVTGDDEFLAYYGAEMILEIARFWSSIATYDRSLDRYEIRGVMGPDEYHDAYPGAGTPGLDNNAYTNVMVVWVLCRALQVLELVPEHRRTELVERLDLRREELERWEDVSRRMRVCFHDGGIVSQFEGYDALLEFDWAGYRSRYGDIHRLDRILEAEGDSVNRYKASKQADVLMLFYLLTADELTALFARLGYDFPKDTIPRTVDYYLQRTSHGSTLSGVVHSWVLARSDRRRSWEFFREALRSDVADVQGGTTPEGIHLGAMAGTVDLVQRCYTGAKFAGGVLWLDPVLPDEVHHLRLHLRYRQHWLELDVDDRRLTIRVRPGVDEAIRIGLDGVVHDVLPGATIELGR